MLILYNTIIKTIYKQGANEQQMKMPTIYNYINNSIRTNVLTEIKSSSVSVSIKIQKQYH